MNQQKGEEAACLFLCSTLTLQIHQAVKSCKFINLLTLTLFVPARSPQMMGVIRAEDEYGRYADSQVKTIYHL